MYTFNLLPLDSSTLMNNRRTTSNSGADTPSKLNVDDCSINELKEQIAQVLSLTDNSFDIYCQGVQLIGDDKRLNDYEIENDDTLVIVNRVQLPTESKQSASAGLPSKSELHQSSKAIEKSATPSEFHRLYWLMKTPEFWRKIIHALPEMLLDSSALGLCEDSVLFCQNYDVNRLTEMVQANPLLYKVISQVLKEWTSTNSSTNNPHDVHLSPAGYFINGSPHLIEQMTPRQPAFNIMPRRITNEDFYRALEQTSRSAATASASRPPPATTTNPTSTPITTQQQQQQQPRTSNRRTIINMDHLRNALQQTSTPTAHESVPTTPTPTTENTSRSGEANAQVLLDQMRAMGLTDEAANRQALEATNWDLKAALDLLLE